MSIKFLNPQYLWLFSLLSIVIILHLIRPRKIVTFVSSLMLWERVLKKSLEGKWFKKLPQNILLYLQLLALSLLVLSLAQPQLYFKGNINSPLVFIIDGSASTSARDIYPSRFERMRQEALSMLRKNLFFRPVAIIIAGQKPELIQSFTIRRDLLERKIKELKVLYSKNSIDSAINFVESLLPNTSKEIHIFSDGNSPISYPKNSINSYFFHIIGKDGNNIGITDAKILQRNKLVSDLFIEISNFSDTVKTFPLELYEDNSLLDRKEITIKPKEIRKIILEIPNSFRKIRVKLNILDNLFEDNEAYLFLPKLEPKILLVSPGNPFLEKALKVIPDAYIDMRREVFQEDFLYYDFIIFDQLIPQTVPAGNYLFIGYPPQSFNFEVINKLSKIKIVSCEDSPLTALVKPVNVNIDSAFLIKSEDFKPLLYSEKGPIGFIYEEYNLFSVILPFSILETDWYYYDSFPIFIYNVINYALSYDPQKFPGETISFREKTPEVSFETPKGEKKVKNNLGYIELSETFTPGFYIARLKNPKIFAVNIFSKEESDIKPKFKIDAEEKTQKDLGFISLSLSPFFIPVVIMILLFEIIIFLRGIRR